MEVKEATIGSIVAISGISDISIGDTLCAPENPQAIPFQKISEPTISMQFIVNDSPFAGREAKIRHVPSPARPSDARIEYRRQPACGRDRKRRQLQSIRTRGTHLSVLIENMRREAL